MRHIRSEEIPSEDFGNIIVKNLFDEDSCKNVSIAEVKLAGKQKFGLDKSSDILYYILEGEGKFFVEHKEMRVKQGDLIYIPKNTKYKDEGDLRLLAISSPKFNASNHIYFD